MLPFEEELVRRLYARDETAMALFYARYGQALRGVILRLVRNQASAEDVLQDCLVKIWCSFAKYDASKGRLFTWALQVSRNTAIDHLRNRHAHEARLTQALDSSAAWEQPAAPAFQPEHVGVRELLQLLRPQDQLLMELLYFEGYTQMEVAEELGMPLGTVKTRTRRAIHQLVQAARADGVAGQPVARQLLAPFNALYTLRTTLLPPPAAPATTLIPANDADRLAALRRYEQLDAATEQLFNELVAVTARLFRVPISVVSLVDAEQVLFKGNHGFEGTSHIGRSFSLCAAAILQDDTTVFEDLQDQPCQLTDPAVAQQHQLRFYGGHPLQTFDGYNIGVLCVIDQKPRALLAAEKVLLRTLAGVVMRLLELRATLGPAAAELCRQVYEPITAQLQQLAARTGQPDAPPPAALIREAAAIAARIDQHLAAALARVSVAAEPAAVAA
jgi:RNA polymerase sigma factor (sigma-70 family)